MKKYILTSVLTLLTYNSYASFDFENYVPTLNIYGTGSMNISGYDLQFIPSTPEESVGFYTYNISNGTYAPIFYGYIISINPDRQTFFDKGIILTNSNGTTPLNMSSLVGYFIHNYTNGIINDNGYIGNFEGDFISNGGSAIYNNNATINNITGDFINNYASNTQYAPLSMGAGGAIYNKSSQITTITGNFIANMSTNGLSGGAIYNDNGYNVGIGTINGSFIGNHSTGSGGAIYNIGPSNILTGIGTINGDFIGNEANISGGAIYNNNSKITNINGDFIANESIISGGAIYTTSSININGDFIGNHVTTSSNTNLALGGAIYSTSDFTIKAGTLFSGNYTLDNRGKIYNAIYMANNSNLELHSNAQSFNDTTNAIIFNDSIDGDGYTVGIRDGLIFINNSITNANHITVNLGSALILGAGDYGIGLIDSTPTLTLHGFFDTANGYADTINLSNLHATPSSAAILMDINDQIIVSEEASGTINLAFNNSDTNLRNQETIFAITPGTATFVMMNADDDVREFRQPFLYDLNFDSSTNSWSATMNHIYNHTYNKSIAWDFLGNHTDTSSATELALGGAMYTNADVSFVATDVPVRFNGNYTLDNRGKIYNAIFVDTTNSSNITVKFDTKFNKPIIFNDQIEGGINNTTYVDYTNPYNITLLHTRTQGENRPEPNEVGYVVFNNDIINAGTVTIKDSILAFDQHTNSDNQITTGRFVNPIATAYTNLTLNNGGFDIANGYTETITLGNLTANNETNFLRLDLDTGNMNSDFIDLTGSISGQINVVIDALNDIDIADNIIWFAMVSGQAPAWQSNFVLESVNNLSYDLNILFDSNDKKWGLQKINTEPENPDNPDEPENPDNPDELDEPDNPDTPENPDNPENPENPDTPTEPGQPVQPTVPVLPVEVVQMADYTAKTVTNTVQKLTNSMQKRVGELQWLSKETDTESGLNNAFWTRGIHKNFDTKDTSVGLSGIEFGYDRIISSTNNYKWYIGGLGYISGGDSKFKDTKLDISGYGLGAYLMVLEKSGWFADAVFRQHFINMETSDIKTDYTASSLNLEIGKEFVFGSDTDKLKWFMKPSLEGTYISISGTDIGSFKVQDSTSSMASLSVLAGPRWDFASGRKFQAYGKVGYTLDNSDDVDVVVNGVNTKQTIATNTTEMGIGFDYRGIDNATNIYLEAAYITGTDYSEISGNLGLRYAF